MQLKIITIRGVGGVAFNMLKDNSVRAHVNLQNAERFKEELQRILLEVHQFQIEAAEAAKSAEVVRYVLPKTRIQQLEEELERLKQSDILAQVGVGMAAPPTNEELARAQTIVSGGFGE